MEKSIHELDSDCTIVKAKTSLIDLPHDLFFFIIGKLVDISDFIRIRATCKRWHSLISLSDSPRVPWIFNHRLITLGAYLELYSLASRKFHTINVPGASDKFFKGPSDGFFLAFDTRNFTLSLLNPFTYKEFPLPSLQLKWSPLCSYFLPELICAGEVVAISGLTSQGILLLASCRSGDDKWVTVEHQVDSKIGGISYYKGMYFVNIESEMGKTTIIDAMTGGFVFFVPAPDRRCNNLKGSWIELLSYDYLVMSSGELLRVFRVWNDYMILGNEYFEIYRLDYAGGCPQWVIVDNIGDRMLFLDAAHGLSLVCRDAPGMKGNSIYFIKPFHWCNGLSKFLCRYDISDGTTEVFPFNVETWADGPWIVPNLR
ncbi:F-box protein At2g05970-like [Carex rostrata]